MDLYTGFIGKEHFKAIVKLLGYSGIAITIKDCILPNCKSLIQNTLLGYLRNLKVFLPENIRLPKMEYGASGVYQFYQHQLRDVLGYSDMKTQVLHYFREVGNALIFVMMIERSLNQQEMYDMLQVIIKLAIPSFFQSDGILKLEFYFNFLFSLHHFVDNIPAPM